MADYTALQISGLAQLIWQDINSPTDKTVAFISGAIIEPTFIAQLNTRLNTSCLATGGAVSGMGDAEAAVLRKMYEADYYGRKAIASLTSSGGYIYSAADGDTKWSREKASDTAKGFRELKRDTERELDGLIQAYKKDKSVPLGVDSYPLSAFPSP
jgi:hypothetical protein